MEKQLEIYLKLKKGFRTALADGSLVPESPLHLATERIYRAFAGDMLILQEEGYLMAPALFSLVRPEEYLYTYAYQKESNWTVYQGNLTPDSYTAEPFLFSEDCYFRVCVKRQDGLQLTEEDGKKADTLVMLRSAERKYDRKPWFAGAIAEKAEEVNLFRNSETTVLCLLSDTHYTVNGTWEDTLQNISAVHKLSPFDGIVHLGDVTDGLLSADMTSFYAKKVLSGLKSCGIPLYLAVGNHDTNYFRGNSERYSEQMMKEVYADGLPQGKLYYAVDFNERLRGLFLTSFDPSQPVRFGFDDKELEWVKEALQNTPIGQAVIVFCHNAPIRELDYWSFSIRNGERLLDILENYNSYPGHHILAYFHGHAHADYVYEECSFPIIATGCAKCEYFTDKKPEGFQTPYRRLNSYSQELWDIMLVDVDRGQIRLLRFGAGEDRTIDCRKRKSVRDEIRIQKRLSRKVKIWAHRGMSGHAPENTLPAFEMAAESDADGIELDVQLTKDKIPVVVHDEYIDRVSDGSGFVRDYTLEELKALNFAKNYPSFGRVEIPALQQVLHFFKDQRLEINLELKNSEIYYEGIEENVLELVRTMGMQDRILYSSFNHYSLLKLKKLDPAARIALLYRDILADMPAYAKRCGAEALHPSFSCLQLSAGLAQECRREGIRLHVWTVNDKNQMRRAAELGADAVITNFPELF